MEERRKATNLKACSPSWNKLVGKGGKERRGGGEGKERGRKGGFRGDFKGDFKGSLVLVS